METTRPLSPVCSHCGSRVRTDDAWCSLCYRPLIDGTGGSGAGPEPSVPPPSVTIVPERGPVAVPAAGLVGGTVPPDVVERLAADLAAAEHADGDLRERLPGPVVLAAGGGVVVLTVLLAAMALLGVLV